MTDGGWSDAQEQAILQYYFGGGAAVARSSVFVALCTQQPLDDGTNIYECNYAGYGRKEYAAASGWNTSGATDPSAISNNALLQFDVATAGANQTATHFALMSLVTAGVLYFSGTITNPSGGLLITEGIQPQFDAGALILRLGSVTVT